MRTLRLLRNLIGLDDVVEMLDDFGDSWRVSPTKCRLDGRRTWDADEGLGRPDQINRIGGQQLMG